MSERLAVDTSMTYQSKVFGQKGDDDFPCSGKISRIHFNKSASAIPLTEGEVSIAIPISLFFSMLFSCTEGIAI